MLEFFRNSYLGQYLTVFFLGLILWSPRFLGCSDHVTNSFIVGDPDWVDILKNINPVIGTVLAFLIVYFTGILLNNLASHYEFIEKNSLYVLLMFVVVSSLFAVLENLSLIVINSLFIYLLLFKLFKHDEAPHNVFIALDAGLFLGLVAVWFNPALFLLPVLWISFIIIGGVSWRSFVSSILGVMMPLFGEYLYYFFTGDEQLFFEHFSNSFVSILNFNVPFHFAGFTLSTGMLIVFTIIGLLAISAKGKLSIRSRKLFNILGLFILSTAFLIFVFYSENQISLLFPPVAVIIGYIFNTMAGSKRINILFGIILIMILINNWVSC
jgi:hypothetical protein